MCLFIQAKGVKDVNEKDLLIKFKKEAKKTVEKPKPVTKKQRIKEATNFWKAFFAVHSTKDKKKK